jgi:hypothetical protein
VRANWRILARTAVLGWKKGKGKVCSIGGVITGGFMLKTEERVVLL